MRPERPSGPRARSATPWSTAERPPVGPRRPARAGSTALPPRPPPPTRRSARPCPDRRLDRPPRPAQTGLRPAPGSLTGRSAALDTPDQRSTGPSPAHVGAMTTPAAARPALYPPLSRLSTARRRLVGTLLPPQIAPPRDPRTPAPRPPPARARGQPPAPVSPLATPGGKSVGSWVARAWCAGPIGVGNPVTGLNPVVRARILRFLKLEFFWAG